MKKFFCALLSFFIVFCGSCKKKPETLITEGWDQEEMEAAIERARTELDSFLTELSKGDGTGYAVKAAIDDGEEVEFFWLENITYRDGIFEGTIGNDPGMVEHAKIGRKWTVEKSDIMDWMFFRDDLMHGNYTLRPLLKTFPEEQAEQIRARLANPNLSFKEPN